MACKNCGRDNCPTLTTDARLGAYGGVRVRPDHERTARLSAARKASKDCRAHTVNWRDRALAAEAKLQAVRGAVDGWKTYCPTAWHVIQLDGILDGKDA